MLAHGRACGVVSFTQSCSRTPTRVYIQALAWIEEEQKRQALLIAQEQEKEQRERVAKQLAGTRTHNIIHKNVIIMRATVTALRYKSVYVNRRG